MQEHTGKSFSLVRWKNGHFLVNLVLRHIQCFIAYYDALGSSDHKSAGCQAGMFGENFLWAKIQDGGCELEIRSFSS